MVDRKEFWTELFEHLRRGEPAFLSLVAHNTIHSPGTRGAKMFLRPDDSIEGTIGGGAVEAGVLEKGRRALDSGSFSPDRETLVHRNRADSEEGRESGLICAGKQTHVYYLCRPERDLDVLEEVVRRIDSDEPGLIEIDEEGFRLGREATIDRATPPVRLVEGDETWRYEEQIVNWKRAAVLGSGHVGSAVCRQLALLGYTVENFDTRPDVFTFRDNEWADHQHVVDDYAECGGLVQFPQLSHAIVVTADQPSDVRGLLGLADEPVPYVGAMGSPAKLHKIREDLVDEGVSEEFFERWYAPIGLEMASNKPAEIAVSIAAELLRERESLFPHARPPKP